MIEGRIKAAFESGVFVLKLCGDVRLTLCATLDAEAQRLADDYYAAGPKRLSLPGAAIIVEEEKRDYGAEPWSHGVAGNKHNVETFVRYARDQGYIDRIIPLEEFFVESVMDI